MMNIETGICAFLAYKSAVVISSIPPPETVNNILSEPFRSAIWSMPKQRAFADMPHVIYSGIVQPLIQRSAVQRNERQDVFSTMCVFMADKLPGVNSVALSSLAEIRKNSFLT